MYTCVCVRGRGHAHGWLDIGIKEGFLEELTLKLIVKGQIRASQVH